MKGHDKIFCLYQQQELWDHKELVQVDCSESGEVLSVVCFKEKIFSGHSDGTIKVTILTHFLYGFLTSSIPDNVHPI